MSGCDSFGESFGEWFYRTRMAKRLTIRKVKERCNLESLGFVRLSDIEHGIVEPTPTEANKIRLVLGEKS